MGIVVVRCPVCQMDAYDKDELAAYIAFLAKFALVDSEIDDEEMIFLLALVEAAQLPQEVNDRLCRFIDSTTSEANDMAAFVKTMQLSVLRFELVADLLSLAFADGVYEPEEAKVIHNIAIALKVGTEQISAIEDYMKKAHDHAIRCERGEGDPAAAEGKDLMVLYGAVDSFRAAAIPEEAWGAFKTGQTPASAVTSAALERMMCMLSEVEGEREEGTRGLTGRSFSRYFYHSMISSTKRNALASLVHKITGTRRPHAWISFAYILTGRRRPGRRPGSMLHFAGTLANIFGM